MSYMYLILARAGDPHQGLRLMDIPVAWEHGAFVPRGPLEDRPATQEALWEMLDDEAADHYPFPYTAIPEGWSVLSNFWQPARYVPQSKEVTDQGVRDAVQHMRDLGLATDEQAKRLLEDNDA
jgi:hypothetical protein